MTQNRQPPPLFVSSDSSVVIHPVTECSTSTVPGLVLYEKTV
jgi:hypothetical protein